MKLPPYPCVECSALVVAGVILAKEHGIGVRPVPAPVDFAEQPYALDPDLLLCAGLDASGRRLLIPMDAPGVRNVARAIRRPHCHRVHVCSTVPADWQTATLQIAGAAS